MSKHPMTMVEELRRLAALWERNAAETRQSASFKRGDARTHEFAVTLADCASKLRAIVGREGS